LILLEKLLKPRVKSIAQLMPGRWRLPLIAWRAVSFKYFFTVFRDKPVARATDRILRPSTNIQRRIFDTLSINITCSFLRAIRRGC